MVTARNTAEADESAWDTLSTGTGVFSVKHYGVIAHPSALTQNVTWQRITVTFNAWNFNKTYNGSTVTPLSRKCKYFIKY